MVGVQDFIILYENIYCICIPVLERKQKPENKNREYMVDSIEGRRIYSSSVQ